ncbi:MAG: peptidase M61, partial [Hylemonella sp.]|nr:peptidase M61 [Hylemonella sp.]
DAAVSYRVTVSDPNTHLFQVQVTIAHPQADQVVSLPVWIPGSYLVREFSSNLQGLKASQSSRALALQQLDKCSWRVAAQPEQPLQLSYEVYALDNSVRTAWLDASRAFFNATSLCLRVHGQEQSLHELELVPHPCMSQWSVATGLSPHRVTRRGFGLYRAHDYGELLDCPVEMGDFWSGSFEACGIPHRFVVAGAAPGFDGERLLADTRRICETAIRFWHPASAPRAHRKPPHASYLFLLNASHDGYGGLEHRNSTALLCARKDLPQLGAEPGATPEGYATLLGLISHEYFHTWNVKRLRPAEFAQYDYAQENYTELLWFFEGFTSYYDDLLLCRAGLLDAAQYLKRLDKTVNQVMQTPGRAVQSVAQASFDAWVKLYRQNENTANATVSYYSKGSLVALCLDLSLRAGGRTTLDEVMRSLWQRCQGGPMTQGDLEAVLLQCAGRSYAREIARWVHGTTELPLPELLAHGGLAAVTEPAPLAQRLGLRVNDSHGLKIKTVLRGGAAEQAGFAAGDEWLGVEVGGARQASAWRMSRLDDLLLYAGAHKRVSALVARDQRLLRLDLKLPRPATVLRLSTQDQALLDRWLLG